MPWHPALAPTWLQGGWPHEPWVAADRCHQQEQVWPLCVTTSTLVPQFPLSVTTPSHEPHHYELDHHSWDPLTQSPPAPPLLSTLGCPIPRDPTSPRNSVPGVSHANKPPIPRVPGPQRAPVTMNSVPRVSHPQEAPSPGGPMPWEPCPHGAHIPRISQPQGISLPGSPVPRVLCPKGSLSSWSPWP